MEQQSNIGEKDLLQLIEEKKFDEIVSKLQEEHTYNGIRVLKENTQTVLKKMRENVVRIKNVNPVCALNERENLIITTFVQGDKDKLDELLSLPVNSEIKSLILSTELHTIKLNYSNFSYYEAMKKLLTPVNQAQDQTKTSSSLNLLEIPKSFEIIGNIAHLNLREKFLPYKHLIAKIILDKNPNLKTVINKTDKIDNVYRTYNMEVLGGAENFLVSHREGNINFHFDIRTVYWCSRLQNERDRLLKLIKKGQVLCDAFCGVGPLALRAAKQGVKVYANDLNPSCFEFLKKNIQLNKIDKNLLFPFNMDARSFIRMCISQGKDENEAENNTLLFKKGERIDHFYMNLPKDAIEFLDAFRGAFKESDVYTKDNLPIVHVYGFSNAPEPKEDLLNRVCKAFNIKELPEKDFIEIVNIRDVSTKKHMFSISIRIPVEVGFE